MPRFFFTISRGRMLELMFAIAYNKKYPLFSQLDSVGKLDRYHAIVVSKQN